MVYSHLTSTHTSVLVTEFPVRALINENHWVRLKPDRVSLTLDSNNYYTVLSLNPIFGRSPGLSKTPNQ